MSFTISPCGGNGITHSGGMRGNCWTSRRRLPRQGPSVLWDLRPFPPHPQCRDAFRPGDGWRDPRNRPHRDRRKGMASGSRSRFPIPSPRPPRLDQPHGALQAGRPHPGLRGGVDARDHPVLAAVATGAPPASAIRSRPSQREFRVRWPWPVSGGPEARVPGGFPCVRRAPPIPFLSGSTGHRPSVAGHRDGPLRGPPRWRMRDRGRTAGPPVRPPRRPGTGKPPAAVPPGACVPRVRPYSAAGGWSRAPKAPTIRWVPLCPACHLPMAEVGWLLPSRPCATVPDDSS